jgi:uncharacterized protein YegL
MTNPNLTLIAIILDRSGSMEAIRQDMEGGLTAFLLDQKAIPGECIISLYTFDHRLETEFEEVRLEAVEPIRILPRGNTALFDAIGRTTADIGLNLAKRPEEERPGRVIILVITDGEENSSRQYTRERVKAVIEKQERDYNWKYVFLGANMDAQAEARSIGLQGAAAMTYDASAQGVMRGVNAVSSGISAYRRNANLRAAINLQPGADTEDKDKHEKHLTTSRDPGA